MSAFVGCKGICKNVYFDIYTVFYYILHTERCTAYNVHERTRV
jgi:hypothetical protein